MQFETWMQPGLVYINPDQISHLVKNQPLPLTVRPLTRKSDGCLSRIFQTNFDLSQVLSDSPVNIQISIAQSLSQCYKQPEKNPDLQHLDLL